MINWINGKTDAFKALVCHDGNLDERMAYFDTEELWFPEWEHGGVPWDKPEGYTKHNPVDLVKNWKTPTLVIHGGLDYRVVDTQGMSTSPRCSARASRAASCSSPTRTTGCSSRRTPSYGTTKSWPGSTSTPSAERTRGGLAFARVGVFGRLGALAAGDRAQRREVVAARTRPSLRPDTCRCRSAYLASGLVRSRPRSGYGGTSWGHRLTAEM